MTRTGHFLPGQPGPPAESTTPPQGPIPAGRDHGNVTGTTPFTEEPLDVLAEASSPPPAARVKPNPSALTVVAPQAASNWQYVPEATQAPLARPLPPLAREIFIPDIGCEQDLDPGPCRQYTVSWYYDSVANACAQFWFGGCEGNRNRFETESHCINACVRI
ncbi:hypothetical protein AAFF_G00270620 [Aldrovandia affinis]|uniref:BPTI/Kunitz inhibitor domain-containing protein n=1 Tax=Aldrovandia affinis TaxID=143900 RepID=A0AAD7W1N5_9TELE|nr:hypothetical protein AAFF_G00270620 [Aldrovandia affinis]